MLAFDLNIGVKSTSENIAGSKHFKKFGRGLPGLDLFGDCQLEKILESENDFDIASNSEECGSRISDEEDDEAQKYRDKRKQLARDPAQAILGEIGEEEEPQDPLDHPTQKLRLAKRATQTQAGQLTQERAQEPAAAALLDNFHSPSRDVPNDQPTRFLGKLKTKSRFSLFEAPVSPTPAEEASGDEADSCSANHVELELVD